MPYWLIPRCIYYTNMQAVDSYYGTKHKKVVKMGVVVRLQHLCGDTAFAVYTCSLNGPLFLSTETKS
jgi:hypothetical protein